MTTKIDETLFRQLLTTAAQSPRKRSHYNLHKELDEPVQRLCIALIKGTYVRPHHHIKANNWELMLALSGRVALLLFNGDGVVLDRIILSNTESVAAVELTPGTWHTVVPLTDQAIIMEVKEGPYTPTEPNDFALWAPDEGDESVGDFLRWLESADKGDRYSLA